MRVFVSHTQELNDFVETAVKILKRHNHIPIEQRNLKQGADALEVCRSAIEKCDLFIGIIGFRYGSTTEEKPSELLLDDVHGNSGKFRYEVLPRSYPMFEYAVAREIKIPLTMFLMSEEYAAEYPKYRGNDDVDSAYQLMFRQAIRKNITLPPPFSGVSDFGDLLEASLKQFTAELEPLKSQVMKVSTQEVVAHSARQTAHIGSTPTDIVSEGAIVAGPRSRLSAMFQTVNDVFAINVKEGNINVTRVSDSTVMQRVEVFGESDFRSLVMSQEGEVIIVQTGLGLTLYRFDSQMKLVRWCQVGVTIESGLVLGVRYVRNMAEIYVGNAEGVHLLKTDGISQPQHLGRIADRLSAVAILNEGVVGVEPDGKLRCDGLETSISGLDSEYLWNLVDGWSCATESLFAVAGMSQGTSRLAAVKVVRSSRPEVREVVMSGEVRSLYVPRPPRGKCGPRALVVEMPEGFQSLTWESLVGHSG